jgi:hypothetical protein
VNFALCSNTLLPKDSSFCLPERLRASESKKENEFITENLLGKWEKGREEVLFAKTGGGRGKWESERNDLWFMIPGSKRRCCPWTQLVIWSSIAK